MKNLFAFAFSLLAMAAVGTVIYFRFLRQEPPFNSQYEFINIVDGLERPVYLTHAGDDRLFVVEQRGVVWIISDGELLDEPFLDIQDVVNDSDNEQGLLSLAFDPDYAENGVFYVFYTGEDGRVGNEHIVRFQVSADDPDQADLNSAEEILMVEDPYGNHNGGQLQFGPDGYLYIGIGDGGSGGDPHGNGQKLTTLMGKLLRIDVHSDDPYGIPKDNPFVETPDALPEIWAYGLRNPWRFSFDRQTGDLFIADVGQNETEEVDFQPASSKGGENYGWSIFEGTSTYKGNPNNVDESLYVFPVSSYEHNATISFVEQNITRTAHCSITGGYVYRGETLPALQGTYLYGDYCSGSIWSLKPDGEEWSAQPFMATDFQISSFGEDAAGELYLLTFSDGGIWKLVVHPSD